MRRNDSLLRALVATPHPLAATRPRALSVAPPQPLPPQAGFGPMSPGQITNSPFTGAVAAGGPMNVVHPQQDAPPMFQAPVYQPLTARPAARLAPLVNVPAVFASPLAPAAPAGGGATAPSAPPPPVHSPLPGAQQVAAINYANPARQQSTASGEVYEGALPQRQSQNALIAALAQLGRKVNLSRAI